MESFLNPYDWPEVGNRTSKTLGVTYDGRVWELPPYPAIVRVPTIVAQKAIEQHARMGTENPYDASQFEALVFVRGAVNGYGEPWPEDPIEQSDAIERIDASLLEDDRQNREVLHFGRVHPEKMNAGKNALFLGDKVSD